jgi:hypothetical protein
MTTAKGPTNNSQAESTITARAAELEAELSAVRQLSSIMDTLRRIKARFPRLVEEIRSELLAALDEKPTEHGRELWISPEAETGGSEYGVEKLIAFFRERCNEPATIQQMAKAIGRSEKTVKSIVYHRHRKRFETMEERGRNNRAYFRLADN